MDRVEVEDLEPRRFELAVCNVPIRIVLEHFIIVFPPVGDPVQA